MLRILAHKQSMQFWRDKYTDFCLIGGGKGAQILALETILPTNLAPWNSAAPYRFWKWKKKKNTANLLLLTKNVLLNETKGFKWKIKVTSPCGDIQAEHSSGSMSTQNHCSLLLPVPFIQSKCSKRLHVHSARGLYLPSRILLSSMGYRYQISKPLYTYI